MVIVTFTADSFILVYCPFGISIVLVQYMSSAVDNASLYNTHVAVKFLPISTVGDCGCIIP